MKRKNPHSRPQRLNYVLIPPKSPVDASMTQKMAVNCPHKAALRVSKTKKPECGAQKSATWRSAYSAPRFSLILGLARASRQHPSFSHWLKFPPAIIGRRLTARPNLLTISLLTSVIGSVEDVIEESERRFDLEVMGRRFGRGSPPHRTRVLGSNGAEK
jgi:hypothetical protein